MGKKGKGRNHGSLVRHGIYTIEEVLSKRYAIGTPDSQSEVVFGEFTTRMNSRRYQVFEDSLVCRDCGIEGKFFAQENFVGQGSKKRAHMNLYGLDANGKEVLMTKGSVHYPEGHETTCQHCHNKWYNNYIR